MRKKQRPRNSSGSAAILVGGKPYHHKKIRIAYLSADFRKHATAYLIAGAI